MLKKQLFICVDLNKLHGYEYDPVPLRSKEGLNDIINSYGEIKDGMQIWCFDLTKYKGKYDPTIFPGRIIYPGVESEYEIKVNEKDMEYLSESEKFKDYSVEDVIGKEWYEELKRTEPELL